MISIKFNAPEGDGYSEKSVPVCWFTNMKHTRRNEEIKLWQRYTPEAYPQYDNYDAINVDKVVDIPMDYEGYMGVPITFMDKFNPEQFEIVGMDRPLMTELTGKQSRFKIKGVEKYARIVIKNKTEMKLSKTEYKELHKQRYWAKQANDYNLRERLHQIERIIHACRAEGLGHLPPECFTLHRMRFILAQHQTAILEEIVARNENRDADSRI